MISLNINTPHGCFKKNTATKGQQRLLMTQKQDAISFKGKYTYDDDNSSDLKGKALAFLIPITILGLGVGGLSLYKGLTSPSEPTTSQGGVPPAEQVSQQPAPPAVVLDPQDPNKGPVGFNMPTGFSEDVCVYSPSAQNQTGQAINIAGTDLQRLQSQTQGVVDCITQGGTYFDHYSQNGQTFFSEIVVSNPQTLQSPAATSPQAPSPAVASNSGEIFNATTAPIPEPTSQPAPQPAPTPAASPRPDSIDNIYNPLLIPGTSRYNPDMSDEEFGDYLLEELDNIQQEENNNSSSNANPFRENADVLEEMGFPTLNP